MESILVMMLERAGSFGGAVSVRRERPSTHAGLMLHGNVEPYVCRPCGHVGALYTWFRFRQRLGWFLISNIDEVAPYEHAECKPTPNVKGVFGASKHADLLWEILVSSYST
jgi:hypothetical protein